MVRNTIGLLVIACFGLLLNGCAGVVLAGGATAATVAYVNGELQATENTTMDQAWLATLQAVQAMELQPVSKEKDALTARLHAKGAGDKDVYINMKTLREDQVEIRIRVNVFGDRAMSERILNEIEKRL